jgi:hypothetical protein
LEKNQILIEKYKGYKVQKGGGSAIAHYDISKFLVTSLFFWSHYLGEDRFENGGYRAVPNLNNDNPEGESWGQTHSQGEAQGLQVPER